MWGREVSNLVQGSEALKTAPFSIPPCVFKTRPEKGTTVLMASCELRAFHIITFKSHYVIQGKHCYLLVTDEENEAQVEAVESEFDPGSIHYQRTVLSVFP